MIKTIQWLVIVLASIQLQAQSSKKEPPKPRFITWKDVSNWKFMNTYNVKLAADGKWFAYPMLTTEGDGELVVKKIRDTAERRYPIGGSSLPSFEFSEDGKWLAYKESAKYKEVEASRKNPGKPLYDKLIVVDLAKNKKTEFEKVSNYSFNGKKASHLAFVIAQEKSPMAKPDEASGNDLILLEMNTDKKINIGNVREFEFSTDGTMLAYTIDAANKNGNGLYLLHLATHQTTVLDNDNATYKSLSWKKDKDALTVLKITKDEKFKTDKGAVLAVKNLAATPSIYNYDPIKDSLKFPKKMTISSVRQPYWSDDLSRVFFGINTLEAVKKELAADTTLKIAQPTAKEAVVTVAKIKADTTIKTMEDLKRALEKADTSKTKMAAKPDPPKNDATKPDMTIWHWKDKRLQSRQQVMEMVDKNFSYVAMYDVSSKKFSQLNDSNMRMLNVLPQQRYALGEDVDAYELEQNLSGQIYSDLYITNLATGAKTLFKKKFYTPSFASRPKASFDGTKLVYGEDGHFYVYDIVSQKATNLTAKLPVSFIDIEDDHNVTKPLTDVIGWSSDSKYILINDGWDIWQIPVNGMSATNLTQDGRQNKIRYQMRYTLDPNEKGFDLKQPNYFRMYGEQNKKSGIAKINAGGNGLKAGAQKLQWDEVAIANLQKAKNAGVYIFSVENNNKPTEYFAANALLADTVQLTQNAPLYKNYLWSPGTQLVNYVTTYGDSLQGTLFLPAGYEAGKKYPTLVYYYEKLSQTAHSYANPSFPGGGWNPAMYTGNGYAVFIPDIVYKLDDPGMSTVAAVLPAVKEAIKTGVIDENKIGITGHSWGGYQTAFLITQTNMFKAAAAGAPLTDMVSMYNLIYWNSGGGNMSIFEASQGRFRGGPWDNWDAYLRNSPIYHVKKVQTPLLLLHNDKDGAVDFTQGIEYYNALRRLQKPVVMLQYKGENHGLSKLENRKDYAVRMMEFFDHYLKGKPMPDWLKNGIDKLKLPDHLEERAF